MPHSVLVVDDSPTAVPELKSVLESSDYSVLTALRAEEALDTLRISKVDLIITEALLPGMDGFTLVRQIRSNPAWTAIPIIILTVRSAQEDYRAGFESGANEYFVKPTEPPKILAAVGGLIARADAISHMPAALPVHTPASVRRVKERGEIITVFSLKGGVGTTSLAVNLAIGIKRWMPSARVGLVDLSMEEALCALLLDVMPTSTIVEWAREDRPESTPAALNQYFIQHSSGISLMAAPQSPEEAEIVKPQVVRRALELAPQVFDYLIVDTASTFSEISLIALESAQNIVLPVTPDMAALKSAVSTLRILKALSIQQSHVHMVMNEIIPRAGLTKEQLEKGLGKTVTTIPHAGPGFVEAANQGTPFVTFAPSTASARALLNLARGLCEPEVESLDEDKDQNAGGLLGRFRPR